MSSIDMVVSGVLRLYFWASRRVMIPFQAWVTNPLSQVKPEEKTTPAGRFLAASDKNIKGADIVWIDYDSAVSFHAVVKGKPEEHRAERLASPQPSEQRISFGCVNVPVNFFKTALHASFKSRTAWFTFCLKLGRSTKFLRLFMM